MKIQIVSYILDLNPAEKLAITTEIINKSKSDLVFFSGNTIDTLDNAISLSECVKNKKSTVLFEVSQLSIGDLNTQIIHCPFLIRNGKLENMHTFQYFTTSDIIEGDEFLAKAFVNELETRRQFEVGGHKCLLLLCGENNILKNIQSEKNKVVIRIDNKKLVKRFTDVIKGVDLILNLIHMPQPGNQNKLHKRREYFSKNCRMYISTNNCKELSSKAKSIQYVYYDGNELEMGEPEFDSDGRYMCRYVEL